MRGIVVALAMLVAVPANAGISIQGRALDMTVTIDRWNLGNVVAHGIVVTMKQIPGGVRACGRATVEDVALDGCATVPSSHAELRAVTWHARAKTWKAHGEAAVIRRGEIRGHAVIDAGAVLDVATTGPVTDLEARGELRGHGVTIPFTAHADLLHSKVTSFVAQMLGGELSLEPVTVQWREPIVLGLHARGIELARLVPSKLQATGVLDGELAARIDGHGMSLTWAALHAREPGRIRVTDPSWLPKGEGLTRRVAGALADFEYDQLALALAPRGIDPEVQLSLRGHGKSVDQDLDLTVNLHGFRQVAEHVIARVRRTS